MPKSNNFDPDEIGGSSVGNGPGSVSDPTSQGGASLEGGSRQPNPKYQRRADGRRIRFSGNNPNVGGGREGSPGPGNTNKVTNANMKLDDNTKGGMVKGHSGRTTQSGEYTDPDDIGEVNNIDKNKQ